MGSRLSWQPDRLLDGYQSATWVVEGATLEPGEPEVDLTATLVRRNPPRHRSAVLYVHGWSDYFFQTHVADFFDELGYDFYAVELRRYGRNLAPGLFAGYISNLDDYAAELDAALAEVRLDHDHVLGYGHSTGGLVISLWASAHPGELDALLLNSPWLAMGGPPWLWALGKPVLDSLGAANPLYPVPASDSGFTVRATHLGDGGEWDFDRDLKTHPAFFARFGWGLAIQAGQSKVAAGLGIDVPILMLTSAASKFTTIWNESLRGVDFVLDVQRIAAASVHLGNHLTLVRVPGALHDVTLSAKPVREAVFDEIRHWLAAYGPGQRSA